MKCVVEKNILMRGLSIVEAAIGRSPTLPLLGYVLLKAEEKKLELVTTNLELSLVTQVPATVEKPFTIAVPFRAFLGLIQHTEHDKITLSGARTTLEIQTPAHKAKLQGGPLEEFPLIPEVKTGVEITFNDVQAFKKAVESAIVAVSQSDVRPELGGVLVEVGEEQATIAATDTFRMCVRQVPGISAKEPKVFILPKKTAEVIVRIMREAKTIEAKANPTQVVFTDGTTHIISRLIEGTFPDFEAIIPKDEAAAIKISRETFLKELSAASIFASRLNDVRLTINPQQGSVRVYAANTDVGEYETEFKGAARGQAITLSFNFRYFTDGLVGFPEAKDVTVSFVGEGKPGIVRAADDKNEKNLYLVASIRTDA